MQNNLPGFDPLVFLNINGVTLQGKDALSKDLMAEMSTYIILRISELLPQDDLTAIGEDAEKFMALAKEKIPDLNDKVKMFAEDFKKEFQNNLKQL